MQLDDDSEILATNFHGSLKTDRPYITPKIVFVGATGSREAATLAFPYTNFNQS